MKQIFTLLILFTIASTSIGQSFTNKPLISKRTADWCPNCGNWGWSFKTAMLEEISADEASIVALHHSGNLKNDAADAIVKNLGGAGQPRFYLNNTDIGASSSNWMDKLETLKNDVSASNAEIPKVGIDLRAFPGAANEIVTKINLHINQAIDGEYYVGTYLIINDLEHPQSGSVTDNIHKKLLTDAFTDDPFGTLIGNGPILEGVMNFDVSKTFEEIPDLPIDVVVVIWKKEMENYIVETTGVIENVQDMTSSNDNNNWIASANAFFNADQISLNLESLNEIGEYQIRLVSSNGQEVYFYKSSAYANSINTNIETTNIPNGTYFINVLTNNGIWNQQIQIVR